MRGKQKSNPRTLLLLLAMSNSKHLKIQIFSFKHVNKKLHYHWTSLLCWTEMSFITEKELNWPPFLSLSFSEDFLFSLRILKIRTPKIEREKYDEQKEFFSPKIYIGHEGSTYFTQWWLSWLISLSTYLFFKVAINLNTKGCNWEKKSSKMKKAWHLI